MTMNMWNWFVSLAFGDRVMVVALYILGVVVVILWARFITKRLDGGLLYRVIGVIASSSNWQYLLSKVCNSLRGAVFYYPSKNTGDNQKPYVQLFHRIRNVASKCMSINKEKNQNFFRMYNNSL
jgi:hypothetical protein